MSNRKLDSVPAEVRHSLDVLDSILGEFEAEEQRLRPSSSSDVRIFDDVPQDVRKSLEVLDSILDEIEHENPTPPDYRAHFQSRDTPTLDRKYRHDDIRRSIEVLDSVLAEFDDCLESWDASSHFDPAYGKSQFTDINSNAVKSALPEVQLDCRSASKDGSTSHFSPSIVPDQSRISSPPPIPKRSPGTKLSDVNLFTFPTCDDNSLDSLLDSALSSNHASSQQRIREPLSSPATDNSSSSDKCHRDKCANCGRGLKQIAMEQQQDTETSSSPFHQRKQMFEAKIAEASKSPSLNRPYGQASFKQKRPLQLETSSDVSGDSGFGNESELPLSELSNVVSLESPSQTSTGNGFLNGHHGKKCTCKDRIRQLDAKFSNVRRLLKLNKIKGLNAKPPNFDPPPPPLISNGHSLHTTCHRQDGKLARTFSKENFPHDTNSSSDYLPKTATNDSLMDISHHDADHSRSVSGSINSLTSIADFKLCNRCSSSVSIHTIEDLPKLLPTDALNRPHLGFSYSMEEDLSPGVKEIRQTSTPKCDVSSPRLYRTKESNLSTFSHSASSLGYISSQSDLELNDLSILPDKVPISSFKSRTLPNGLDRSPFYSAEDDALDKHYSDYNDNRLKAHHKSTILDNDAPAPEAEKPKHKHFRVFSRKTKKDKKKSDCIRNSAGSFPKFYCDLQLPTFTDLNLAKILPKLDLWTTAQMPALLFTSVVWQILHFSFQFLSSLANSVAILVCYLYLKNHRRHTLIIVHGYVAIFKTFAEFIGAVVCVCYGLLEVDFYHTILGIACILIGITLKAVLLCQQAKPGDRLLKLTAYSLSILYIFLICVCSLAFHQIILRAGLLPCLSRIATCVVPLVALADNFGSEGGPACAHFSYVADAAVVVVLWWFCSHMSLKYFVVVPMVIGVLFSFIQYLIREVQLVATTETETDLYGK